MINKEKLLTAKEWIGKLANGINPLNDELIKDDDIVNNVHISRCLFYVAELLDEIKAGAAVKSKNWKKFYLSSNNT